MIRRAVERPVSTLLAALTVVVLGIFSLLRLPVSLLPSLERPSLTIVAAAPGSGREEVLERITRPLELRLASLSGVISVRSGKLPAMKITEPYSPIARASASVNPVASAGMTVGRITRRNTIQRLAPSDSSASSRLTSTSSSAGCTDRTTNGMPIKVNATVMPTHVYAT